MKRDWRILREMAVKVFLSYGREDGAAATRLRDDLRSDSVEIWRDRDNLLPGERWKDVIAEAIRKSDYFIAVLSSSSVSRRGYLNAEIREALAVVAELPANEPFIIPVRLDECESTHRELSEFNRVDLFPAWSDGVRQLLRLFLRKAVGHTPWLLQLEVGHFERVLNEAMNIPGTRNAREVIGTFDLMLELAGNDLRLQQKLLREIIGVRKAAVLVPILSEDK
jgi:hypothetical protein